MAHTTSKATMKADQPERVSIGPRAGSGWLGCAGKGGGVKVETGEVLIIQASAERPFMAKMP